MGELWLYFDNFNFLGASPDGINNQKDSPLFGRIFEIKNVYNRFINGIPKEEYWIQMQIQMENCNLDLCDFLETRFIEYTENDFYKDTIHYYKGVILHFLKLIIMDLILMMSMYQLMNIILLINVQIIKI